MTNGNIALLEFFKRLKVLSPTGIWYADSQTGKSHDFVIFFILRLNLEFTNCSTIESYGQSI
jgi:hypothetical protein